MYGVVLTARQSQTALLIVRGHSSSSIARLMGVSVQTVKVFRKQIHMRCSISSQAELFAMMMPILVKIGER
nr:MULTISPECIES: LuxR C-terminal-related transcriptional regulator [unclassified Gluconobacter]